MGFGVGVEGVAGDYDGGGVGDGTALYRNAACMGPVESEEVGESTGRVLLDYGQCVGNFVCVDVGVERGEDQFGGDAGGVGRGVELAHEAPVPGVYRVLQDLLYLLEEAGLSQAILGYAKIQELRELVGPVVLDKCGAWASTLG